MATDTYEKKRIRQRYDVDLKAEISLDGAAARVLQCRITNLSASGACLHFEAAPSCRVGTNITIKLFIPETIMHIPNSGEIVWVKKQNNTVQAGIRFKDIFSEIMMERLVKNGLPETPYRPA